MIAPRDRREAIEALGVEGVTIDEAGANTRPRSTWALIERAVGAM
jgi:hypothetical protein